MPGLRSGHVTASFLHDVSEGIDLGKVGTLIGSTVPARPAPKPTTPAYIQYSQPPLAVEAESTSFGTPLAFPTRFKIFDYGGVSVALTLPLPSTWGELVDHAIEWYEDARLSATAEALCRRLLTQVEPALMTDGNLRHRVLRARTRGRY